MYLLLASKWNLPLVLEESVEHAQVAPAHGGLARRAKVLGDLRAGSARGGCGRSRWGLLPGPLQVFRTAPKTSCWLA